MELKTELINIGDPQWETQVCQYVCGNRQHFDELVLHFFSSDFRGAHGATKILLACAKIKPEWLAEQVPNMVRTLSKDLPVWSKRNILRVIQYQSIPEELWGHTADQCFNYLASTDEPVAVKVFSMTVIYNLTKEVPDLARELRLLIEDQYPLGSAGFKARGRKVLNQLQKDGH